MQKFRKKPVVIEAKQFNSIDDYLEIVEWVRDDKGDSFADELEFRSPVMLINTLEGVMVANLGDWIIKGIQGEFYPCKPEIFEATYESVN